MPMRAILISLVGAIAAGLAVMTVAPAAGELCEDCACRSLGPLARR